MSGQVFIERMRRVNINAHGFRSTFKEWARSCKGSEYADEISEHALAHVNREQPRAAYARDQLLSQRALLMQDWDSD